MDVSKQILGARKRKKFTRRALAQKVGCTETQVFRWERGTNRPGEKFALPLSRALGLSLEDLLKPENPSKASQLNTPPDGDVSRGGDSPEAA